MGQKNNDTLTLEDLIEQGSKFIQENFDPQFIDSLNEVDQKTVEEFLRQFQSLFQGEYVIDIAGLKNGVQRIISILDMNEETKPYAEWLKSRVDYFEVADELRLLIPPPEPDKPKTPAMNPTSELERKLWDKQLSKKPIPKGSDKYLSLLKSVFISEKMPPELVWIAEVESSFNPKAKSPVGAAGLFQLMPTTAKRFGLSLFPEDERYDPAKSARASAKYLRFLYNKFKDWHLAIAAYNAGEGTIQRCLEKFKARSFDEICVYLPAETQMYVPRVESTVYRRERVKLNDLKIN